MPLTYVVALIMMAFTAYSYGRMIQEYPYSGSAYTYTQRSIGDYPGFFVGWIVLLDYLFLPMLNVLVAGIFLNSAIPAISYWVWIILILVTITTLSVIGVKISATVNSLLILY